MTVDVTGAKDANGNDQMDYTPLAEFSIDTLNPTVVSVTARTTLDHRRDCRDRHVQRGGGVRPGDGHDGAAAPTLTFAPSVASTLSLTGGAWSAGDTTYTATYSVADATWI